MGKTRVGRSNLSFPGGEEVGTVIILSPAYFQARLKIGAHKEFSFIIPWVISLKDDYRPHYQIKVRLHNGDIDNAATATFMIAVYHSYPPAELIQSIESLHDCLLLGHLWHLCFHKFSNH